MPFVALINEDISIKVLRELLESTWNRLKSSSLGSIIAVYM